MKVTIKGYSVLLDQQDEALLSQRSWRIGTFRSGIHYVVATGGVLFHRLLVAAPRGLEVDHINGNGLDNRRSNLRLCTHDQNTKNRKISRNNTSGFKGVSRINTAKTPIWRARIHSNGRFISLGCFRSPEEAHRAYINGSIKYHGEFGRFD
jgi:hypothetical protein